MSISGSSRRAKPGTRGVEQGFLISLDAARLLHDAANRLAWDERRRRSSARPGWCLLAGRGLAAANRARPTHKVRKQSDKAPEPAAFSTLSRADPSPFRGGGWGRGERSWSRKELCLGLATRHPSPPTPLPETERVGRERRSRSTRPPAIAPSPGLAGLRMRHPCCETPPRSNSVGSAT